MRVFSEATVPLGPNSKVTFTSPPPPNPWIPAPSAEVHTNNIRNCLCGEEVRNPQCHFSLSDFNFPCCLAYATKLCPSLTKLYPTLTNFLLYRGGLWRFEAKARQVQMLKWQMLIWLLVEVFIRVIVNVLVPNETYKLENLKLKVCIPKGISTPQEMNSWNVANWKNSKKPLHEPEQLIETPSLTDIVCDMVLCQHNSLSCSKTAFFICSLSPWHSINKVSLCLITCCIFFLLRITLQR